MCLARCVHVANFHVQEHAHVQMHPCVAKGRDAVTRRPLGLDGYGHYRLTSYPEMGSKQRGKQLVLVSPDSEVSGGSCSDEKPMVSSRDAHFSSLSSERYLL